MKVILVLSAVCVCFVSTSVQACRILMLSDQHEQQIVDAAYFIGLVRAQYLQQFPDGKFKEAGFKPFAVYTAVPDINFENMIVVSGDGGGCENYNANQGELVEVIVMKYGNQLKLNNLGFPEKSMNKLRQKMRYVGAE